MLESAKLSKESWVSEAAGKVFAALDNNARFVGGCVRDMLLERPLKDIDLATPLHPEKVAELLEKAEIKALPTGIKHGTITAIVDKKPIEITTLRRDEKTDGRHAEVAYTDNWQEDAARRDFTINAMSMDLAGNIHDYFSGREDLQTKTIKFIGSPEARIAEDYLRILRFFRFGAQLETNNLDAGGIAASGKMADGLKKLSGERIQAEMFKILAAPDPLYVLNLMAREKILAAIGIEKPNLEILQKLIERENDEKEISKYFAIDPIFRLGFLLLSSVLNPEEIAARWKLPNRTKDNLALLLSAKDFPKEEKPAKKILRRLGKENFQNIIKIGLVLERLDNKNFLHMMVLSETWEIPEIPVNGNELLRLGMVQGKDVGDLLTKLENWWEGKNYKPTKVEMLNHAKTLIPGGKGW